MTSDDSTVTRNPKFELSHHAHQPQSDQRYPQLKKSVSDISARIPPQAQPEIYTIRSSEWSSHSATVVPTATPPELERDGWSHQNRQNTVRGTCCGHMSGSASPSRIPFHCALRRDYCTTVGRG